MGLDLWAWVLCVLAAFAVGLAKGGLSMIGMLGVPLMALVMSPVQAAGILLPVSEQVSLVHAGRGEVGQHHAPLHIADIITPDTVQQWFNQGQQVTGI